MKNIYYDPQEFGLEILEVINDDNADYTFDDFVIFKYKKDGKLYWASDSGCSCPTPFEDIGIDDLTPIGSLEQLDSDIEAWRGNSSLPNCTFDRKKEVLELVKKHLN